MYASLRCTQSSLPSLYATLVHDGVAGSGHYWAFLNLPRGRTENVWFKFNDTHVTPVDANTVIEIEPAVETGGNSLA